ncbi:hypothetical protein C8F04DRAFT_1187977 [Mycena alexandri]|uniref:Uncharacterized protein n=1 Tax=Mycena alexandri TaxID=1745969 RepID=A0AAD6WYC2_9AGAR|nr:hypothetical protein C8F04DRAFT_1187977 [Mycena alexandri]
MSYSVGKTVTLYGLSENVASLTVVDDETFSLSAAGINSNGGTTYVEIVAETSLVAFEPDTTVTEISIPTTYTGLSDLICAEVRIGTNIISAATFVEDASARVWSILDFDPGPSTMSAAESCGFGADGGGGGTCVETFPGPTETFTESGAVVAFYTFTVATPTSSHSGVLRSAFTAWNRVSVVVFVALCQAL